MTADGKSRTTPKTLPPGQAPRPEPGLPLLDSEHHSVEQLSPARESSPQEPASDLGTAPSKRFAIEVGAGDRPERVDKVLSAALPSLSRRAGRALIAEGRVFVDGRRCRIASKIVGPGTRLVVFSRGDALGGGGDVGDELEAEIDVEASVDVHGQTWAHDQTRARDLHQPLGPDSAPAPDPDPNPDRELAQTIGILFADDDVLVVNKPPALCVHMTDTRGDWSLVEILERRGYGALFPLHRLDRGTSGVVALARRASVAAELTRAFRMRSVKKRYVAFIEGRTEDGLIDEPIGRDPRRPRLYAVRPDGRSAQTVVRTVSFTSGVSALSLDLLTGRTHQIRVHLASRGVPVLGDRVYGARTAVRLGDQTVVLARPALHAAVLELPLSGGARSFVAPLAPDLRVFEEAGLALEDAYA